MNLVNRTLAEFRESPLYRAYPLEVSASVLAARLKLVEKTNTSLNPCTEAISFYALNQLMAKIQMMFSQNTVLPDWALEVARAYDSQLVHQHQHLVWYLFLIITREFRHLKNSQAFFDKHPQMYPKELRVMHSMVIDSSSQSQCNNWLNAVPDMPLARYCDAIALAFGKGTWPGAYGGKPWENIAGTLGRYIKGESSAEVLVDTAYTLAHNTAPIFNKTMIYETPLTSDLMKVLDVQRSGQVCEGIIEGVFESMFTKYVWVLVNTTSPLLQGAVGTYVDWYKVEQWAQDGHKYSAQKLAQDKKYGKPKTTKLVDGQPVQVTGSYEAALGVFLETYTRMKAA